MTVNCVFEVIIIIGKYCIHEALIYIAIVIRRPVTPDSFRDFRA